MSAHAVPAENFIQSLRMKDRRNEWTPAKSHTDWEPPVLVQAHHYISFIWATVDNLNLDEKTASVLIDMIEKPAKYDADYHAWMSDMGEADYDRRLG